MEMANAIFDRLARIRLNLEIRRQRGRTRAQIPGALIPLSIAGACSALGLVYALKYGLPTVGAPRLQDLLNAPFTSEGFMPFMGFNLLAGLFALFGLMALLRVGHQAEETATTLLDEVAKAAGKRDYTLADLEKKDVALRQKMEMANAIFDRLARIRLNLEIRRQRGRTRAQIPGALIPLSIAGACSALGLVYALKYGLPTVICARVRPRCRRISKLRRRMWHYGRRWKWPTPFSIA